MVCSNCSPEVVINWLTFAEVRRMFPARRYPAPDRLPEQRDRFYPTDAGDWANIAGDVGGVVEGGLVVDQMAAGVVFAGCATLTALYASDGVPGVPSLPAITNRLLFGEPGATFVGELARIDEFRLQRQPVVGLSWAQAAEAHVDDMSAGSRADQHLSILDFLRNNVPGLIVETRNLEPVPGEIPAWPDAGVATITPATSVA